MTDAASITLASVITENLALVYLLGMCTLLSVTTHVRTAVGLGLAVIVVQSITVPVNAALDRFIFRAGALAWAGLPHLDLSYLRLIVLIGVIAASVQILELILDRFYPRLHGAMGIYLPLLTVNCAILGGSLFALQDELGVLDSAVFGFGSGVGWALAAIALAALRERVGYSDMPTHLRGAAAAFLLAGLLSMAFSGLSGIEV